MFARVACLITCATFTATVKGDDAPKPISLTSETLKNGAVGYFAKRDGKREVHFKFKVREVINESELIAVRSEGDGTGYELHVKGVKTEGLTRGKVITLAGTYTVVRWSQMNDVTRWVVEQRAIKREKESRKTVAEFLPDIPLKLDQVGQFQTNHMPYQLKVREVISKDEAMIETIEFNNTGMMPFILRGQPTKGLVDGAVIKLPDTYKVVDTRKFRGATVFVLEKITEEKTKDK